MCSNFILNLFIVYKLNIFPGNPTNTFTLKNCLFGTIKLTWNADKSKFTYNGWGITFDGKSISSFDNDTKRNVVIFVVENSSSPDINDPKNNFLVFGKRPTESINSIVGRAEKKDSINLSKANTKFCLGLHYNGD